MRRRNMKKYVSLLVLCCAYASSSLAASLSPQDLIGDYSGDKGCIVEIEEYPGNMLEITMIKRGRVEAVEYLAKYRVETISDDGDFKIEQEFYGFNGEETKEFSGEISNYRLVELELARRQSKFSVSKHKCKDMVRIRR